MTRRGARLLPAAAVGLGALLPWPDRAVAQMVDQGALEQVFGEPVTTSATGKPQRASDVPANMEIVTADDIRRSGADNLPDVLRFVAGLDVRRYGFAAADVAVRGYNETSNPRLLVLVNGQQVYLDDLGRTQWYTLPVQLEEIRQVEIVRGPNTALFGFNAASGVINIVTYDPLHDKVNTATARVGTQGYTALSAVGTGQVGDKAGVRLSAGGFRAREFNPANVAPPDLAYRSSPQNGSVEADVRVQVTPGVEVFASGSAVNSRTWEATASPYFGTDFQRTNAVRAGITADTRVGLLGLSAYRNELRYSYSGATEREDLRDQVYVVQASDLLKLGTDHAVRVGLDYRNNMATSSTVLPGQIGYEVFSASLMWDWQVTPRVSLTNAVRYDHFVMNQHGSFAAVDGAPNRYSGHTINEPSFNSGLVWKATDADTVRLTAARGLQLPSIYDLGLRDQEQYSDGTYYYLGQPRLNAAAVSNVELGYDRALPSLGSTATAAVFAQRTDNIITNPYEADPVISPPLQLYTAGNVGHSAAVGGELTLRGQSPSGFRWKASYSYISISDHLSINSTGLYSPQDFQHNTPTHVVVLGAGYTHGPFELDVAGRWQSRFRDYKADPAASTLSPVEIGNYVVLNGRAAYTFNNFTLALTAQQFNNSHVLQSASAPVERRFFLTLSAKL